MKGLALFLAVAVTTAVVAVSAVLVGGGATTPSARAALRTNGLFAHDVLTNRGPLQACSPDGSDCTAANWLRNVVYVTNLNRLTNTQTPSTLTRATLRNAFVVNSVDETIYVNGAEFSHDTLTPPPNLTERFATAGRWPSTVTCGQPITVPCTVVTSPAILPGENTVIFWDAWIHLSNEPNGTYVFKYTVHGMLNGTPVDLGASSPPIHMTG